MDLQRQISRKLHEEHVAVIALLERFEQALGRLRELPPGAEDPVWRHLLAQLDSALQYEVSRHFSLEEDHLFPRLHQHGDGDLAELLFEEHESIRQIAQPLLERIGQARSGALEAAGWRSLKASGLQLAEMLGSHARKEEGSLVPLVDEILDEDTDQALWNEYAAG
jgi:hemerythrin-like domain-containing protein